MKKLYRLRHDRILGGVAAGIAEYFEVDVVLVRLIWVLVALTGGAGVLAYIIAWIIIPPEPEDEARRYSESRVKPPTHGPSDEPPVDNCIDAETPNSVDVKPDLPRTETPPQMEKAKTSPRTMFGLLLVVIGAILLANRLFPFTWHFFWNRLLFRWWPLAIVILGVFIMWRAIRGDGR